MQLVPTWKRDYEICNTWFTGCLRKDYLSIRRMRDDASYKAYFTYLNYSPRIQSMIYTTNWIERLQKDFRRVTRMRGAMPNEESVLVLMGKTAMDSHPTTVSYRVLRLTEHSFHQQAPMMLLMKMWFVFIMV